MEQVDLNMMDQYLAGTLSDQDMILFEERLSHDQDFKKLFNEYQDLQIGVDYSILKTTKEELQVLEASLPEVEIVKQIDATEGKPPLKITRKSVLLKMAAALLVLVLSTFVIVNYLGPSDPEALFTKHFEPYPNEFVSLKRGENPQENLKLQAFQAYDNKNYRGAIGDFEILLNDQEDAMVLFYLGNAQLASNENRNAIDTFQNFLEMSDDFKTEAKWYLALAFLKEHQLEEAKGLLNEIKNDGEFGLKASDLLGNLE